MDGILFHNELLVKEVYGKPRKKRKCHVALPLVTGLERETGGGEGDRTPGLDIANVALSQLSYTPVRHAV